MSNYLPATLAFVAMLIVFPALANDDSVPSGGKQKDVSEWAAAYRWPDPPPPGSLPGAIGGFGAPSITTIGGPDIAPTSPSDNKLLQGLSRRAEQLRDEMRGTGQLSGP